MIYMNIYKEDSYFVIEHIYDDGRSNARLNLPFNSAYLENIEDNVILIRSAKNNDVICTTTLDNLTINDEAVSLDTLYEDFDAVATAAGGSGPTGPDWFTVTNLTDVDGSVGFLWAGAYNSIPSFSTVEYSSDGENWTVWDPSINADSPQVYLTLPANGNLYFRNGDMYNKNSYARVKFYCDVDYKVSGKLSHLCDLVMGTVSTFYQFLNASSSTRRHLIDAGDLILPENIANDMFNGLFSYQDKLIIPPKLPSMTLTQGCYREMFYGCSSLTTAPELPATTITPYCYYRMFETCTSLTTAPELPATTLADWCYQHMFDRCSSLTTAPELPATATTLACYNQMFSGCSSLNYVKCLLTTFGAGAPLFWMLHGVSSTGTFECAAGTKATWESVTDPDIPTGWTVVEV